MNWTYVCAIFMDEVQISLHQTQKPKIENEKLNTEKACYDSSF